MADARAHLASYITPPLAIPLAAVLFMLARMIQIHWQ